MSGLTATGFETKTLAELKIELQDALKATFGASIDLSEQEPFGQILGVMAERFADLWALGQALYQAGTPDGATGVALDEIAALTGTLRLAATTSTVIITATGTPATVLAVGRSISVATIGTRFTTTAAGTITAVSAWVGSTGYLVGDRVKNSSKIYQCITAGTSASSGGPTTTASDITDGTVHWRFLGNGTGAVDITAESEQTGPKVAAAGTLTVIGSPVSGWSSVTNFLDAVLGRDLETDADLRLRREAELRATGKAALETIRAAVLEVSGVIACTVFENVTDTTDGDGVPGHAIETLVRGGVDADIAAKIFATVAAGIRAYGSTPNTVTDSQGIAHTISFTRPTEKTVWATVNLTADVALWPTDGVDQVKAAIVAYGDLQATGKDVVSAALVAQTFKVAGVLDAEALIRLINPPIATTTIPIGTRELAVYDSGRIIVNVVFGTP